MIWISFFSRDKRKNVGRRGVNIRRNLWLKVDDWKSLGWKQVVHTYMLMQEKTGAPNSPKTKMIRSWRSMEFCCWSFRLQMHKPLVHDSPFSSVYHQGTGPSLLELHKFMALSGLGFPDSPNTTGWPPRVFQGLAPMDQLSKSTTKKQPSSQIPNPTNVVGCPPLVFRGFKILIPINFTICPSYVQCKQRLLQKEWFLDMWPYVGGKENSPK